MLLISHRGQYASHCTTGWISDERQLRTLSQLVFSKSPEAPHYPASSAEGLEPCD